MTRPNPALRTNLLAIQAEILRDAPLETRAARVQAVVDQALADVRITQ